MSMDEHAKFSRAVRDLVLAGERFRARAGRRHRLSPTGITALASLRLDGPQSPSQLAALLDITTASATELLDRLVHRGFITRTPHPRDRRKLLIKLTEAGAEQISTVLNSFAARLEPLTDRLDPHQRRALLDVIQAAHATLRAPDAEAGHGTAS